MRPTHPCAWRAGRPACATRRCATRCCRPHPEAFTSDARDRAASTPPQSYLGRLGLERPEGGHFLLGALARRRAWSARSACERDDAHQGAPHRASIVGMMVRARRAATGIGRALLDALHRRRRASRGSRDADPDASPPASERRCGSTSAPASSAMAAALRRAIKVARPLPRQGHMMLLPVNAASPRMTRRPSLSRSPPASPATTRTRCRWQAREFIARLRAAGRRAVERVRAAQRARPRAGARRRLADRRAGRTTTRRWTATRCAAPTCEPTRRRVLRDGRHRPRRQAVRRRGRRRRVRAHHDRRRDAGRPRHRRAAGVRRSAEGDRVTRAGRRRARPATTAAWPAKTWRAARRRCAPGRVLRPADIGLLASLGHGRGAGAAPPARGLLFHRRRAALDRRAARRRLRLRQQPLHAVRHAAAPGRRRCSTSASCATTRPRSRPRSARAARSADAVITSGGVSVGEADHTKQVMAQLGDVLFWRIAMRPGRPMAFGRIAPAERPTRSAILFGLPGNPVAVMVTFYAFVRDALLRDGRRDAGAAADAARRAAPTPIRKKPGRTEYQRGIVTPRRRRPLAGRASPARRARASCAA